MKKMPKNAEIYVCENCNFKCSKKSNFDKHLLNRKHKILTNPNEKMPKNAAAFQCECGKVYKHNSTLSSHKKKCTFIIEMTKSEIVPIQSENNDYKHLLMQAMNEMKEQRQEFIDEMKKKDQMLAHNDELMGQMIDKVGNTTNNTSNNLNINMFLNEECKDAINFSDFIEKIEISHHDLENNAQLGFVNGITKILMDNLKQLNLYQRPIHCTDTKRETLYIKDDNQWQKDTVKEKINSAIQDVSRKSVSTLLEWKKDNPEYEDINSDFSNKCIKMQQGSLPGEKKDIFYQKITHSLAKENTLNKKVIEDMKKS